MKKLREVKSFTDEEKEEFTRRFYEVSGMHDQDSPSPWGCPWFHGENIVLSGETVEKMVDDYLRLLGSELSDYWI